MSTSKDSSNQRLKRLTFPSLASLTLAACGGGGGGGPMVQTPPANRAPVAAADKTLTIDEDATNQALEITAPSDPDGNSLTITVTAVPSGGTLAMADGTEVTANSILTISQLTGLVFTPDANLNDDTTTFGTFTYRVSDGSLTDTGTVTISVTPVNDAPELLGGPDLAIDENHTATPDIGGTDVDGDTLTYSITGGDDQSFFTIDASTGALSFITRPDYENPEDSDLNNTYLVEVTVTDPSGLTDNKTFTITVNDVTTHVAITNTAIDENDAGAIVGTLSAAIDDINATHSYTYTLTGADADSFEVVDGQLKLKDGIAANYEVKNSYAVTVTATDTGGLTTSQAFTVTINDINDAPTDVEISRTGLMDNTDGAEVGTLTTIDEDAVDSHTYTVSDDRFEVTSGGVLKLKAGQSIDNLTEPTVTLTVTSTDKGGETVQHEFTLTVGTVQITATTFEENAVGVVIGTLSVIDGVFSGNITYTLSGTGSENFEVVDGQLKLKDGISANYEVLNSYSLTITATDDSGYAKATTYPFEVIDVNDAPTAIALSGTAIDENAAGAVIGDLTTTDEDAGDSHTYTLTGADAASFEIVNGQLKFKDGIAANYEVKNSYAVTVTATDTGGLTTSQAFTVTINDINDAPTAINLTGSLYVNDGSTGGVVGELTTVDEDAVDNHTYTISGTDASKFEVVDGKLKLKDTFTPDNATQSTYSITVTSTDKGDEAISKTYTVEVNVAPTDLALDSYTVDENYIGSAVGTISSTDSNTNDEFTYTLSGTDAASFELVSGQLKVKPGTWLDYETKSTYSVTITVTDQGGLTFDKTVTINVNDVNYGNPYVNENYSVFDKLVDDTMDYSILGNMWTLYQNDNGYYYYGDYALRFKHDDDPNTPLIITYSIVTTDSIFADNYAAGYRSYAHTNVVNGSSAWEDLVDQAFEYWGNVSGITFVKVDDNANMCGDIRIGLSSGDFSGGGFAFVPYGLAMRDSSQSGSAMNDIWIRASYDPSTGSTYAPAILIHEIGHTIGLAHTMHSSQYFPPIAENTSIGYSVMSYISTWGYVQNDWPGYTSSVIYYNQPGINDIQALQFLYGMSPQNNQGNTTYSWSGPIRVTIYDTGGTDTIDVSNYSLDCTIDLTPGSISYLGTAELKVEVPDGHGGDDWYYGYIGFPVAIDVNTIIENVTTGSGNDSITCNVALNTIICGNGNDNVYDISAGDTVFGGHGYDNFYIISFNFTLIDGGTGTNSIDGEGDSLYFFGTYPDSTIDLRSFTDAQLTGIEDININDGKATVIKISEQALRDLEGTYTRDLDGDGTQETVHYIYTYDDSSIDEVQINDEGWTLVTTLTVDENNVFSGYDYYSSSDGTIWFAVNSGTSVITISSSGVGESLNPENWNGEFMIVGNKNANIPRRTDEKEDTDSRLAEDDLPNLWVESSDLGDIVLPDVAPETVDLPKPDLTLLAGLAADDTENLIMVFELMTEDDVISARIESIRPIEFDPISQLDLIIDTDWNPIQEELVYTSELV